MKRKAMCESSDVPHRQVESFVDEAIVHFEGPVLSNPDAAFVTLDIVVVHPHHPPSCLHFPFVVVSIMPQNASALLFNVTNNTFFRPIFPFADC